MVCLSIGMLLVIVNLVLGQYTFDVADRTHLDAAKEGFLETEMVFQLPNGEKGDYIFNKIRQIVTCGIICSNGEICFAVLYIRCENTTPLKCSKNKNERCRLPVHRRREDSYHPGYPDFYPYTKREPQYRPPYGDNYVYNRPSEIYPVRPVPPNYNRYTYYSPILNSEGYVNPNAPKYNGYQLPAYSPTAAPGYRPGYAPGYGYINSPGAGYTYDSRYRNGTNGGNSVSCIYTFLVSVSVAVMCMFCV